MKTRRRGKARLAPTVPSRSSARPLDIRGHHLLCVLGFRGFGYSEAFVVNMTRVVKRMRSRPQTVLALTDSADSICAACPHLYRKSCRRKRGAATSARNRDLAVLRRLGLGVGARITVGNAYALVREKLASERIAMEICSGCSWWECGYCKDGLKKLLMSRRRAWPTSCG